MLKSEVYPADSIEFLINEKLGELITLCKEKIYTAEFKADEDFNSDRVELETLGMIVAKYCDWDVDNIETVALAAFEDANYRGVMIKY